MTRESARAYVKRLAETGRLLEEQRWRELAALDAATALAARTLISAALLVPIPDHGARGRDWLNCGTFCWIDVEGVIVRQGRSLNRSAPSLELKDDLEPESRLR